MTDPKNLVENKASRESVLYGRNLQETEETDLH